MTDPRVYFGGTPTAPEGYQTGKSVARAIWDDFIENSPLDDIVRVGGDWIGTALGQTSNATSFQSGVVAGSVGAKNRVAGISPEAATRLAEEARATALQQQSQANMGLGAGPIGVAVGATERAWSYGVARPASTAALIADPSSPLYKQGVVEQLAGYDENGDPIVELVPTQPGFQLDDVRQAWNRSEDVSFGMAAVANPLYSGSLPVRLGGLDQYDPWSVSDMADAQDNPFYQFVTGSIDLGLQIAVPVGAKGIRLKAMDRLGLTTTVRNADDIASFRSDWERFKAGAAESGQDISQPSTLDYAFPNMSDNEWGIYVTELAGESNFSRIKANPLIANSHGTDKAKLARIIQQTSDPDTINEIVLANMGDQQALRNLFDAAPDHVWSLADMNTTVRNMWLNGDEFRPTGEALNRVNQIFDSALARDEYFDEVRRIFLTENGLPRYGSTWAPTRYNEQTGKMWDPLANWLSRNTTTVVERTRRKAANASVTIREADFERSPTWLHETMDSRVPGQPVVRFMHWVGSRQPLGTVSRSGARPDDMWQELNANLDQVPMFSSTRPIVVSRELHSDGTFKDVTMTPAQYRQTLVQRIVDGQFEGGLQAAWQGVEDDIVRVMAYNMGIPDEAVAAIVAGYRRRMDETMTYLQNNSAYLYDDAAEQIRLSPDSRRALLDAFPTLPLGEISKALRGELSPALRAWQSGTEGAEWLFDQGAKIFRTNVLFRFGYIPKNSIGEPMLASWLAHGTVLSDEGLAATLGNFGRNRANNVKRVQYSLDMKNRIKNMVRNSGLPRSERSQLAREMMELVRQRTVVQRAVEDQYALLEQIKAGVYGPTIRAQFSEELRGRLVDAQIQLESIEAALDGRLPEWRQVVEPASLPELSIRLRELRAATGQDDAYARELKQELDDIRQAVRERDTARSPRARKEREVELLQQQIDRIDARLERLSEDYDQPRTDVSDIGIAGTDATRSSGQAGVDPDIARGRDLQAIALQRQKTALIDRRDAEIASLADMPATSGAGATPNEAARMSYIETVLRQLDGRTSNVDAQIVDSIQSLQNEYDDILESFNIPAFDPAKRIEALEKQLDAIEAKMGSVQVRQGDEVSKRQSVSGVRSYRGSGDGYMTVWVGGERMQVPAAFSDRAYDFGPGYRAEASAATTTRQTFDPSYFAASNSLRWDLVGSPKKVLPSDATYWDELAHVGNRIFRSEPLIQRILTAAPGTERRVAAEWLSTPEGLKYQKTMGRNYLQVQESRSPARPLPNTDPTAGAATATRGVRTVLMQSTTDLDDVIRLTLQYFPDPRVRQMLAAGDMDSGTLQRLMGGRSDLKPVVGEDLMYNPNRAARIGKGIDKALDKIWQWIATDIEDRVARWPFFQREFRTQLQRRINILQTQGMKIGVDEAHALRQSASRAALVELEKTFYNIRRYSTPVYQARFLMSFPGAFFNSIYRYGRFTAREPERVFLTSQMFGNMIEYMGVDENGDPVGNDLSKAVYLLIPGTKSGPTDSGVRIPLASFNSLAVGLPGLSFLATYAVSKVVEKNPTAEEILKEGLGAYYDEVFPYGIPRDPASVMLGGYQKDVLTAFSDSGVFSDVLQTLGLSDDKFMQTAVQVYGDDMAQWERGGRVGEAPTFEGALDATRGFILGTANIKFFNPLSTNRPVPGQLMRDAWYEVRSIFGPTREDEARTFFMEAYGDWARWYTFSSTKYTSYIPSTQDAYDRVFNDFASLTRKLVSMDPDDPSMVSLITIGTQGDFSEAVSNYLRENPLPGDQLPVASKLDPEQFDNKVRVDDGWAWYEQNKPLYDAERARLVELRDSAETQFDKDYYRTWIGNTDDQWKSTVKAYEADNIPWMLSRAPSSNKSVKAAVFLTTILQDEKFRKGPGSTPTWQLIDQFLADRQSALTALQGMTKTEDKQNLKAQFYEYVMGGPASEDKDFAAMFNRYFASEWADE